MRYKPFKRIDGQYSISEVPTGQTLPLIIPNEILALAICFSLNQIYDEAYNNGHYDGEMGR